MVATVNSRSSAKTRLPLEEFFKVLLFGYDIELKNRFQRIGQEHGTSAANAIVNLHRNWKGIDDGIKLTSTEELAVKAILRNPRLSAPALAKILGTKERQAERICASLRDMAGLRHRGSKKTGGGYFEGEMSK